MGSALCLVVMASLGQSVPDVPPAPGTSAGASQGAPASPADGPSAVPEDPTAGLPGPGGSAPPATPLQPAPHATAPAVAPPPVVRPLTADPLAPPAVAPAPKRPARTGAEAPVPDPFGDPTPAPVRRPPTVQGTSSLSPPSPAVVIVPYVAAIGSLFFISQNVGLGIAGFLLTPSIGDFMVGHPGRALGCALLRGLGAVAIYGGATSANVPVVLVGVGTVLVLTIAEPIWALHDGQSEYEQSVRKGSTPLSVTPVLMPRSTDAQGTPTPAWAGLALAGGF
jgi:hypothetical protein